MSSIRTLLVWLAVGLLLTACQDLPPVRAQAAVPTLIPTVVVEEVLPETYPTEGPDPVATEYALAALAAVATPTPGPAQRSIVQATPDLLRQLENYAVRPTEAPQPDHVNEVPFDAFVVMDRAVIDRVREIFASGRSVGRSAEVFSKAGDSTIESPYFLGRFDASPYNLGPYRFLQAVVDHFQGSYGRKSMAVRVGQHSWTLLNPAWADKQHCDVGEAPLACEFRLNNPSVVILRLGANDAGVPKLFEKNMRAVVEFSIAQGVIPVLSTKPDRRKGTEQVNDIVRQLATEYRIPLWDFDRVAQTLPDRGLGPDGVHLTGFYEHDYTLPRGLQRGHGVQNLTALIVLDKIWRVLEKP
jgi:hypothetical protein